jgi:hypothetical protein
MLVLDIPRKCPSNFAHIEMPLYHRVHLGLAANRALHGCLLAGCNDPFLPELVISPFDFDQWDKLWRLNLTVGDREGLFHEVCEALLSNGARVLAAESSTTEQQSLYQLETVFAAESENCIEWIRLALLTRFLDEMTFLQDGNPRLRIQRLQSLYHAKSAFEQQRSRPVSFSPLKATLQVRWAKETAPKTLRLILPQKVRDILRSTVRQRSGEHQDEGFYLRQSDTKNRFLRVLYFRSDDPVLYARVEYDYSPDATVKVTEALKSNTVNIITAYLGPSESRNRSRLELVMRCNNWWNLPVAEKKVALQRILGSALDAQKLNIVVGYPGSYATGWERRGVKPVTDDLLTGRAKEDRWFESLREALVMQEQKFNLKAHRGLDPADIPRSKLLRRLSRKYHKLVGSHSTNGNVLFVSCHYERTQLEMIKTEARLHHFSVITGEDLVSYDGIRKGLLARVSACTHFLGVWTGDGAQQHGTQYWPSPWLLWEFGVADAFGLTWRLLISEQIDKSAWSKIASDRQHTFFGLDFERRLREVLAALSELPGSSPTTSDSMESRDEYAL